MVILELSRKHKVILASTSSRRHELLHELGLEFTVVAPPIQEEFVPHNIPRCEIAENIAVQKANQFNNLDDNEILITADTIVWIDNKVLGKPQNYEDAFAMLQLLSGKTHYVITGVCIKSKDKIKVFHCETLVKFAEINEEEINYYIENYKPYDKAGAYGIQEWIGKIGIEYISGCYYNVMGLPVQKLYEELLMFSY